MSTDLFTFVDGEEDKPVKPVKPKLVIPTGSTTEQKEALNNQYDADMAVYEAQMQVFEKEAKEWNSKNHKALGTMILRIDEAFHHTIEGKNAPEAWEALSETYGKPGPSAIYSDFKALLNYRISGNTHPTPEITRMAEIVNRLRSNEIELPDLVLAMILLNALPQKWDGLATIVLQTTDKDNLDWAEVSQSIITRWEQSAKPAIDNAQKISAVKRKQGDPNFKRQWKPAPANHGGQSGGNNGNDDGNGQKKKRGKRAGKGKGKQVERSHDIIAAVTPTPLTPSVPPPLKSRIAHITMNGIKFRDERVFPGSHQYGKPNQFPKFRKSKDLATDIGVSPTPQVIRNLETILDPPTASGSNVTLDEDERPSKRLRSEEPVETSRDEDSGEDAVSLFSGDDLDEDIADAAGINDGQVPFSSLHTITTDAVDTTAVCKSNFCAVMTSLFGANICIHCVDFASCASCKGKGKLHHHQQNHEFVPWIMDSGASKHYTPYASDFIDYEKLPEPTTVTTASTQLQVVGVGSVLFKHPLMLPNGKEQLRVTRLYPVHHVKGMSEPRLLSMGTFIRSGMTVRGNSQQIGLYKPGHKVPEIMSYPMTPGNTIYTVKQYPVEGLYKAYSSIFAVDYVTMHRRHGHPSVDVLRRSRGHTKGFPEGITFPKEAPICPGCAEGKMKSKSFPPSEKRASKPFEKIHSDLKSFPVESYHRFKYFITFFDDCTSHGWIVCLRAKSEAITAMRQFTAMVKTQYNATIKEWMSDAGGEYKSNEFLEALKDLGINVLQSVPHVHQQNGRAERFIQTIMDKAQPMRLEACLPQSWWEFAVLHAVHVYNRTPLKRLKWRTPYEALNNEVPDISHLRVFGCGAYVHLPEDVRPNKLSPKSELMIYLGVAEGVKGYKFMRLPKNIIFTGATAVFDEEMFPKCPDQKRRTTTHLGQDRNSADNEPQDIPSEVDDDDIAPDENHNDHPAPLPEPEVEEEPDHVNGQDGNLDAPNPPQPAPPPEEPPAPEQQPRRSGRERKIVNRPDNVYGENRNPVDIYKDVERKGKWREMVGEKTSRSQNPPPAARDKVPGPNSSQNPNPNSDNTSTSDNAAEIDTLLAKLCREGGVELADYLLAQAVPDSELLPDESKVREWTFRDISKLPKEAQEEWKTACREELEALRKRKVFELVDLPSGRKVIKNRWVFDVKTDGRKKARLVAKGFSQVEGIDFDQIFSPVVRFETVRLILALAALEDWHISGVDVKSAYLYGKLDEEIYMEQPEGFKAKGENWNKVYRLLRAIYGLKQAGLAWWRALNESMELLGCKRLASDAGIFIFKDKDGGLVVIVVYVDDALFCGKNKALVAKLKADFMRRWECRDLGDSKEFLRMRIQRRAGNIYIDQVPYLEKVLRRFGQENANPKTTPLPAGYKPTPYTGPVNPERRQRFQTVIGSLLYIMLGTRPDIAFAVTKLSQFTVNPSQEHLDKALYICQYLAGTKNYALTYYGKSGMGIIACCDSDWANDSSRRSVTGYFLKLANGVFSWQSRAQKTVAHSATEAEYMALSDCSRQVVWIKNLLEEVGYDLNALPICSDNQGAIFLSSNPVQEKRTKHIDIRYHYIREVVANGKVELFHISGTENPADMFTKNLGPQLFLKFRSRLGLEFYSPKRH